jgi:nitrite reductase/ring-hydroxylating ferredoxin subunit
LNVLLCRIEQEWFAIEAHCAIDDGSMESARHSRYTLICPRHAGCVYDLRQGARLGGGGRLTCLPVQRDDRDRVLVGFGMPFVPRLPSH